MQLVLVSLKDEDSAAPLVAFMLIGTGIDAIYLLISFNSSNEETVVAFMLMFIMGMVGLLALQFYYGNDIEPLPFAKNPGLKGIALAATLGGVVLVLNIVAVSVFSLNLLPSTYGALQGIQTNSILFVPKFFSTAQVGSTSTLDNIVFQVILTAPGEEVLKAAMLYGFYIATKSQLLSVGLSIGIWASMHVILVHFSWIEVALAFGSGLIFWASWKKTGSILGAIIPHGIYDGVIAAL